MISNQSLGKKPDHHVQSTNHITKAKFWKINYILKYIILYSLVENNDKSQTTLLNYVTGQRLRAH